MLFRLARVPGLLSTGPFLDVRLFVHSFVVPVSPAAPATTSAPRSLGAFSARIQRTQNALRSVALAALATVTGCRCLLRTSKTRRRRHTFEVAVKQGVRVARRYQSSLPTPLFTIPHALDDGKLHHAARIHRLPIACCCVTPVGAFSARVQRTQNALQ